MTNEFQSSTTLANGATGEANIPTVVVAIPETQIAPVVPVSAVAPAASVINQPKVIEKHAEIHPDQAILDQLIGMQGLKKLWDKTDQVQTQINEQVNNLKTAGDMLDLIQKSRNFILAGELYYEDAERVLNEVEHRLAFAQRVEKWSTTIARWLLLYEFIWLLALAAGLVWIGISGGGLAPDINQLVSSLAWGGLGGVVGALYALWTHVAENQDFDQQFTMWYFTNPLLGLSLGAFVFLAIRAGFFSLTAGSAQASTIQSAYIVYVLAWIAGFKQNVVYDIVHRILNVFKVDNTGADNQTATAVELKKNQ